MKYAPLGRTGLLVSRLSLGTMTFGAGTELAGGFPNSTDQAAADRMVARAIDGGINLFDSADVYGQGVAEEMLGKALGTRRGEVVIATKTGFRVGANRLDNGLSYRHIIQSAEASLKRLGTDWIDVFLLHRHDPHAPYDETARALERLVQDGKVRYVGLCNHQAWQIERFLGIARQHNYRPMSVAQMYYSLVGRDLEQDCLDFFTDTGLGTMIWSPLAGGFLTGKYRRDGSAAEDGRRAHFQMPPVDIELGYDVVDRLAEIAAAHGATVAQIALAWMLAKPWVSTIIVGASRLDQFEDNLAAIDVQLSADEIAGLDAVTKQKARYPNPRWLPDHAIRLPGRSGPGKA